MTLAITEAVLFLSRSLAASILLKASTLLGLGLIAVWLAGRRRASLRHVILAATFLALAIVPLIAVSGWRLFVEIPVSVGESRASGAAVPLSNDAPRLAFSNPDPSDNAWRFRAPSWAAAAGFVWIAGALVFLLPLALNLWWLRGLRRNGLPWPEGQRLAESIAAGCGIRRPIEVLLQEDTATPLIHGFWRPSIILPCDARDWNDIELRCAVVHELEHARRGDWVTQLFVRAICASYWFHPLVWVAWRRLCLEAERACDDAVIQNEERTEYAEQLVSLARRMSKAHAQPALGMANRSDLSSRVSAVLDSTQHRGRAGLLAAAGTLAAAGFVVLSIAPLHAVAQLRTNQKSESASERTRTGRPSPLDRALYEAAESGEVPDMDRLLNAGANINCALTGDGTPLIGAARKGHLEAVRFLLDRGADPNLSVRGDGNPLIMAAREGHTAIVALLLDRGARVDEVVPDDENALIQASERGMLAVVKLLVSRGANVNARVRVERSSPGDADEWRSPLNMARKGRHADVANYLISVGARE